MISPRTIWLFTFSDLKTIVGPMTIFGITNSLAASVYGTPQAELLSDENVLKRVPRIVFWIWINLLPFVIDNQRQPASIIEDSINKPWRPLLSGRIEPGRAKIWMLCLYPVAVLSSLYLGAIRQCLGLMILGIWYNDLGGSDSHCLVRNLINACGFVCYASGAMEIGIAQPLPASALIISWFGVIAALVFSSVHSQDMPDQDGDRLRHRRTVPLTIGDGPSRWTIATSVLVFNMGGLWFWNPPRWAWAAATGLGLSVCIRTLIYRSVAVDKSTFKLWNLWVVMIYCLPLIKTRDGSFQ